MEPTSNYAAVWFDHEEAKIFVLDPAVDEQIVMAPQHFHPRHPRGRGDPSNHPDDAKRFFHTVARALDHVGELLVMGPSSAKHEFVSYVRTHERALERRIVGVETVDHPTDPQLAAYAKHYFKLRRRESA